MSWLAARRRRLVHGTIAALLLVTALIGVAHHHDEATTDARACAVCVVASHAPAIVEPAGALVPAATVVTRLADGDGVAIAFRAPVLLRGRAPPVSPASQLT